MTQPTITNASASQLTLEVNQLRLGDRTLLADLDSTVSALEDPSGVGIFLRFTASEADSRHVFSLGKFGGISRFTCCHRYEPFWMKPAAGTRGGEIPIETQYLLAETDGENGDSAGNYVLFVPLIDGAFHASLEGSGEDGVSLIVESGDRAVVTKEVVGLFIAVGPDPYALMEQAAESVTAHLKTGRLRRDKILPDFVETFGWCTWDAFYQDVSGDKVREGLASFAAGGVTPRTLILDDGWQSITSHATGEKRLSAFAANEKFPGDLAPMIAMAKQEFGIETFLVWHAFNGYWGGVNAQTLPEYGTRDVARSFSPGVLHYCPTYNKNWWGSAMGVVAPEHIYRFYQDYHRHLRLQGVDGVKVDNQSALEGVAHSFGGRVALMQRYREALEGSVQTQFQGNLINCMSCASEVFYSALNSNIIRTSTDFWPDQPASHGLHLYCNAQVSLWFGEFLQPDWDMFQSGHAMGAYHAAGRAVGGCPIYVSDKPGRHDFDLLRKLVLHDGGVLRCEDPGRPTRDCLFSDPTSEDVLLKIFNTNFESGVVGVFNARYPVEKIEETETEGKAESDTTLASTEAEKAAFKQRKDDEKKAKAAALLARTPPIAGSVSPADVEGLEGDQFAVYAHTSREVRVLERDEKWELSLPPLGYEVFTIVPIDEGIAPIGLSGMFNSGGAVVFREWEDDEVYTVALRGGGQFMAWCETAPTLMSADGAPLDFTYDAVTHLLEADVPQGGVITLRIL